ncbi:MAG: Acetyltransferase [Candidatus Magnetoglobus multicellularis str. Araruama]|uniref:Acetyltransferase n=1 Tax=Candidatus Magnetoglobus multicellularis str. Araruama TaxID=890399 RepID=A0A1V1NTT3_9BACT|nr:MAG: Acetyltransferase [Candidatus Magnetoglobus multicellularis str. Araruama]
MRDAILKTIASRIGGNKELTIETCFVPDANRTLQLGTKKATLTEFNTSHLEDPDDLCGILSPMLCNMGYPCAIQQPFYADLLANIYLGNNVVIKSNVVILDIGKVYIGDNTIISQGVLICAVGHKAHPAHRIALDYARSIHIGPDCQIGENSIIAMGTIIERGVKVLPGSFVSGHIQEGSVIGGIPAQEIRSYKQHAYKSDYNDTINAIIAHCKNSREFELGPYNEGGIDICDFSLIKISQKFI